MSASLPINKDAVPSPQSSTKENSAVIHSHCIMWLFSSELMYGISVAAARCSDYSSRWFDFFSLNFPSLGDYSPSRSSAASSLRSSFENYDPIAILFNNVIVWTQDAIPFGQPRRLCIPVKCFHRTPKLPLLVRSMVH